jgi:hypothetical protein
MKEHFTLRYSANQDGDSVMDLEMTFDNLTDEQLISRMNSWLTVIGKTNINVYLASNIITTTTTTTTFITTTNNTITNNTNTSSDVIENYTGE